MLLVQLFPNHTQKHLHVITYTNHVLFKNSLSASTVVMASLNGVPAKEDCSEVTTVLQSQKGKSTVVF